MRFLADMKIFFRSYCSSLPTFNLQNTKNPSAKESQILQLCKSGELLNAFRFLKSIEPTKITSKPIIYASLVQISTKAISFKSGLQIHARVIKSGLDTDHFVGNSLLSLYFKLGFNFVETRRVFNGLSVKDVVCWTSMISEYVRAGKPQNSIALLWDMLDSGVEPNGFTLSVVIKSCSELGNLRLGLCFHGMVVTRGFSHNNFISCALIDMYGKNCILNDARHIFDELPEPDAICWTSIISAMTRNNLFEQALAFFYLMQRNHGLSPDSFTFGTVLTASGNLGRLEQGKELHAKVVTYGHCCNVVVASSLVDMYGKCGSVEEARRVFDRMSIKNLVTWSALLGAYCQNGYHGSVIELFREIKEPDMYCFGTVVRACAGLGALRQGKEVHCQYVRRSDCRNVIVESALVNLYAKCGCIIFAHRVFMEMPVRNLITWNSMICGFAQNGRGREALEIFEEMIREDINPDYISFITVLFACSHAGLVDEGKKYFKLMSKEYGIEAGVEHYNCMVGLLGRAELLDEAESLIGNSNCRDESSLWIVLLGACTTSTNYAYAERIAKKMMKLEPKYHLSYILLSNVYRAAGRWNDALMIRRMMRDRAVKKMPGKSWVETDNPFF